MRTGSQMKHESGRDLKGCSYAVSVEYLIGAGAFCSNPAGESDERHRQSNLRPTGPSPRPTNPTATAF